VEHAAIAGATDITEYGGWRSYISAQTNQRAQGTG
jgi:allophanate hydrolase